MFWIVIIIIGIIGIVVIAGAKQDREYRKGDDKPTNKLHELLKYKNYVRPITEYTLKHILNMQRETDKRIFNKTIKQLKRDGKLIEKWQYLRVFYIPKRREDRK